MKRHDLGGTWIDFAGDLLVFAVGTELIVERVEPDTSLAFMRSMRCPEAPMFHRFAAAPNGALAAFAKGHDTGAALIVDPVTSRSIGTTHGNNPGTIYWDGSQFIAVWVETQGVLARWHSSNGAITREPIPWPWTNTSTGILDLNPDGSVIYADEGRIYNQPPWTFTKPNVRQGVRVGQWGNGYAPDDRIIVGLPDGHTVFTALHGTADDPRVSVLPSGRILVGAFMTVGASLAVIDLPYPAAEQPPVAPQPPDPTPIPPVPPDPPQPQPVPPGPQPEPEPPIPVPPSYVGDLLMFSVFTDPTKQLLAVKGPKSVSGGGTVLENMDGTIVSIQPDGRVESRPADADGGFERCNVAGSVATWKPGDKAYTFGWVSVAGL